MLNQLLISDAFAQAAEAAPTQEFSITSFVPLILIFGVFYFLIIRPQSKKFKDHQELVKTLKIGNKVVTTGGIIGVIKDINDKEDLISLEISEGVTIKIIRSYVADLVGKKEKEEKKKK